MKQHSDSDTLANELEVMASVGAWDMVTWKNDGMPVKHEFFIVNTSSKEGEWPELEQRIGTLNKREMLGKGFKLKYFNEPELGCHFFVQEGWQLTNPLQAKLILEQFIKLIN